MKAKSRDIIRRAIRGERDRLNSAIAYCERSGRTVLANKHRASIAKLDAAEADMLADFPKKPTTKETP